MHHSVNIIYTSGPQPPGRGLVPGHKEIISVKLIQFYLLSEPDQFYFEQLPNCLRYIHSRLEFYFACLGHVIRCHKIKPPSQQGSEQHELKQTSLKKFFAKGKRPCEKTVEEPTTFTKKSNNLADICSLRNGFGMSIKNVLC